MDDNELATYLANKAGEILVKLRNEYATSLNPKELGELGDKTAQAFLDKELREFRPKDSILSEESFDNLNRLDSKRVWIIDPLDGTKEYSNNQDDFAVHIALWSKESNKEFNLESGCISIPSLKLTHNNKNLRAPTNELNQIRIIISATRPPKNIESIIEMLKSKFPGVGLPEVIPLGSVGAKTSYLIQDKADIYLNLDGFYEWDIAAPAAVAIANGLKVCSVKGDDLIFNQESTFVPNVLMGKSELVDMLVNYLA